MQDITPTMSAALSLPRPRGVIIADVTAESPADAAGLQIGDVLLAVDGVRVSSVSQFRSQSYSRKPGETLQVDYQRDGGPRHAEIVTRPRHAAFDPLQVLASPENHLIPRLGILGIEIDDDLAALLPPLRDRAGVIVATRASEGLGQVIDLEAGDVIHAINGSPVSSLDFLRDKVKNLARGTAVALQVERDGEMQYISFEIE